MGGDEEWQNDHVQEMSTRFLLSKIRNGQSHCTDTYCFGDFQPYEKVINNLEFCDIFKRLLLFVTLQTLIIFVLETICSAFHMLMDRLKRLILNGNTGNTLPRQPPTGPTVN